jgi:hypothetical protein
MLFDHPEKSVCYAPWSYTPAPLWSLFQIGLQVGRAARGAAPAQLPRRRGPGLAKRGASGPRFKPLHTARLLVKAMEA